MAFVCKSVDPGTGNCLEWSEAFVLPSLTAEQGTEVAALIIPVMILAAALRIVRDLMLGPHK